MQSNAGRAKVVGFRVEKRTEITEAIGCRAAAFFYIRGALRAQNPGSANREAAVQCSSQLNGGPPVRCRRPPLIWPTAELAELLPDLGFSRVAAS